MKSELLMDAVAEINDRHILEFMDVKPRKKRKAVLISAISAAACLALIFMAVQTPHIIRPINAPPYNQAHMPPPNEAIPLVRINGENYIYADETLYELPDGYAVIGTVLSADKADSETDFYSAGCKPGEEIFANPDFPNDIYVYTKLFGGDNYRYIKFTNLDKENDS